MTIGAKLQRARILVGLTQEQAAEKMCVSRQTISNWENDKTLPDVSYAKSISQVYGISIDILLSDEKSEDAAVVSGTELDAAQKADPGRTVLVTFFCVWAAFILIFWVLTPISQLALLYGLIIIGIGLPVLTGVVAFLYGLLRVWQSRWLFLLLLFGSAYTLVPYLTFSLINTISSGNINPLDGSMFITGLAISAVAMGLGWLVHWIVSLLPGH